MRYGHTSRGALVWMSLAALALGGSGLLAQPVRESADGMVPASAAMQGNASSNTNAHANTEPSAGTQQEAAPIERRPPPSPPRSPSPQPSSQPQPLGPAGRGPGSQPVGPGTAGLRGPRGQHLAEWMNQHSGMTLEQQERALEREPGFQELPVPTQLRMRGRLAQLNELSPLQRQRIIAHTEAMERLTVEQRSQVRGAMQKLGSLPTDQRRAVARSFRELRQLPPDQRLAAMSGARYGWMNEAQRAALTRLIQVAPMLPQQ